MLPFLKALSGVLSLMMAWVQHDGWQQMQLSNRLLVRTAGLSSVQVFLNVWLAAPQAQGSLRKVLRTWTGIFPEATLATVARQIGSPVVGVLTSLPQKLCLSTA